MRLATMALLLASTALAACSGTTTGTGTGSPPGAAPKKSGFIDVDGGTCPDPSETCVYTDPGTAIDGGKSTTKPPAGPSVYDALFTAPASATVTPDLAGLWAGSTRFSKNELRMLITPSEITIAVRCTAPQTGSVTTVGMTVSAVTSDVSIRTLESKAIGTTNCGLQVEPQTMARCSTGSGSNICFDLNDGSLDFGPFELFGGYGTSSDGPSPMFSKLNDGT